MKRSVRNRRQQLLLQRQLPQNRTRTRLKSAPKPSRKRPATPKRSHERSHWTRSRQSPPLRTNLSLIPRHRTVTPMPEERLQKLLAHAGIASRRKAEELILAGRVSVNGATVTELGSKADLSKDKVKVDGQVIGVPKHHLYFALNKPKNVVSTVRDPEGRQTVMAFFKGFRDR